MIDIQGLTAQEQLDRRKRQNREAQKRFYEKHKKKPSSETPKLYDSQNLREYHKTYYQKNKEIIVSRAKEWYTNKNKPPVLEIPVESRD